MKINFNIPKLYSTHYTGRSIPSVPDSSFMYLPKEECEKDTLNEHRKEFVAGMLAILTAGTVLSAFFIKNTTPKNIIEIAGENIGLNKPEIGSEFTKYAKDKILYPIMSIKNGFKNVKFPMGLITTGEASESHSSALIEHAEELGIKCIKIKSNSKHKNKLISKVYKAIEVAKEHTQNNKSDCVIIDVGNIGNLFNMKKYKVKKEDVSRIEKELTSLPKRIMWSGWSESAEEIPYYYHLTPTKIYLLPE